MGVICARTYRAQSRWATSFPGFLDPCHSTLSEDAVFEDDNIITSRGPATAMPFALALVARLCGEATRDENAMRLLFDRYPATA